MDPTCCAIHVIQHFPRKGGEGIKLLIQLHRLILQGKLLSSQQGKVTETHDYETLGYLEINKIFVKTY